jgi:pimeloyl-[acyl-carrier protein] methyl ester esterase
MANLVILPGLDGTGARFADFISAIAPAVDARVIPFPTDEPLGYAQLETLVRRALPSDRRFVLLAESFSGPLAIRIGADPPRGLAGVILCGTFAKNPYPWLRLMRPLAVRLPV